MELNNFKTLLEAGRAQGEPIALKNGQPVVVVPNDYKELSLEQYLSNPISKRGLVAFSTLESFTRYVNLHKEEGTIILLPLVTPSATAIFDHHTAKGAGWGRHKASFVPLQTDAWKAWLLNNKTWLPQLRFAEFLEERALDVSEPSPADFKQMALTLEATKEVQFKSGLKLSNGDVQLNYQNTTTAKSGQMEFPTDFVVRLQPLTGQPPITVQAFLRYRLEEGRISFKYELRQLDDVSNAIRDAVEKQILKDTGLDPFAGTI